MQEGDIMAEKFCPGAINIKGTPTLEIKECKKCGKSVELFSSENSSVCKNCGFTVYNNVQSCVLWCESALECVGEEAYNRIMENSKKSKPA